MKNYVHLDLLAEDPEVEIRRLTALGATVQARHAANIVLADTEGNEFLPVSGEPGVSPDAVGRGGIACREMDR